MENQHLVSGQLPKNTWTRWAPNLSLRYGNVILVSGYLELTGVNWAKHGLSNLKEVHGKPRRQVPYIWCLTAMLRNSVTAVVVRTRPRAIPLAMITMRKSAHGFPFLSHDEYGAPLGGLLGCRSSATNYLINYSLNCTQLSPITIT